MNYEIIFYHSGQTAGIENRTAELLSGLSLELSRCRAALTPPELAQHLAESLDRTDIVLIIGGLDGGLQSTDKILSVVLSGKNGNIKSDKLVDDDGNTAYLIRSRKQTIIVLPDDAEIIEKMLCMKIKAELQKIYSLTEVNEEKASIEEITRQLDSRLSGLQSMPHADGNLYAGNRDKSLVGLRFLIAALLALGLIQAVLALIFFLMG